jgi:hypothetical protein
MASCHVKLTFPPIESTLCPIKIIMFSPSTTKGVLNWRRQHSGQPGISLSTSSSSRRSPRLDQAAVHALGNAGSHPMLSGDITALVMGGGITSNHPCTPSQCLAFAVVGGNTPQGHLLSSLFQSTLSSSRHSAGTIHAVAARRTKNQVRKGI